MKFKILRGYGLSPQPPEPREAIPRLVNGRSADRRVLSNLCPWMNIFSFGDRLWEVVIVVGYSAVGIEH